VNRPWGMEKSGGWTIAVAIQQGITKHAYTWKNK
jgi:hypothetical protein